MLDRTLSSTTSKSRGKSRIAAPVPPSARSRASRRASAGAGIPSMRRMSPLNRRDAFAPTSGSAATRVLPRSNALRTPTQSWSQASRRTRSAGDSGQAILASSRSPRSARSSNRSPSARCTRTGSGASGGGESLRSGGLSLTDAGATARASSRLPARTPGHPRDWRLQSAPKLREEAEMAGQLAPFGTRASWPAWCPSPDQPLGS